MARNQTHIVRITKTIGMVALCLLFSTQIFAKKPV